MVFVYFSYKTILQKHTRAYRGQEKIARHDLGDHSQTALWVSKHVSRLYGIGGMFEKYGLME